MNLKQTISSLFNFKCLYCEGKGFIFLVGDKTVKISSCGNCKSETKAVPTRKQTPKIGKL